MSDDLIVGADGRTRCGWGAEPAVYRDYHDREWGRPLHGERALFGLLVLETFQSGLSWLTILKKRHAFTSAFDGFDPDRVAAYGTRDVERLMGDAGIVRNRAKIEATVANARATLDLRNQGGLDALVWAFVPRDPVAIGRAVEPPPGERATPRTLADVPSTTPESVALATALRARGFRWVGPTVAYAFMQSAGLVDDHLDGCTTRGGGSRPG